MYKLLFFILFIFPSITFAAQCEVNGKWYQYSSPMCSGSSSRTSNNSQPRTSKQWFRGGSLHNATVARWKSATYQNKLATAADWLTSTKWKGHLKSPNDFNKIKVKSRILVNAVDEVVTVKKIDSLQVNEIAAAIISMSNDLGP